MRSLPLLLLAVACGGEPQPTAPPPAPMTPDIPTALAVPSTSDARMADAPLYDLQLVLEDQNGGSVGLDRYRGSPTIFTMFYTGCQAACPLLISTLQGIEAKLSPEARARLRVLLVSFDPANDTPEAMRKVIADHHVDSTRWTLTRGAGPTADGDVRMLAAVLGIAYNKLSDGGYNHSSVLVLADGEGRALARLDSLAADPTAFVAAVEAATKPGR